MLKKEFKHGWVQTPNEIINHSELSFKAKGLWTYINSKPENWDFAIWRIANETKEGENSIRSGLKELVQYGYLEYRAKKGEDNKFRGQDYILKDEPDFLGDDQNQEAPKNRGTGKRGFINNKELSNTEFSKSLSNIPDQKIENEGWKTEITNHPLFEISKEREFSNLDQDDINYTLELYKVSLKGRQAQFTQAITWLKNAGLDKIKTEKIKANSNSKPYQNNYKKPESEPTYNPHPKVVTQKEGESQEDFELRCKEIEDSQNVSTLRFYTNGKQKSKWSDVFKPNY